MFWEGVKMNESEEMSPDEKDELSLISSSSNNTGLSEMIVEENSLNITVSSTDELMNGVERSIELLFSTASSNNGNVAYNKQHNIDDEELDIDDDEPNNMNELVVLNVGVGEASGSLYQTLVALNKNNFVENQESFKCGVCLTECEPKAGVILTECIHSFCKQCITRIVETTDDVEIKCPFKDSEYACNTIIPQREIKEICGAATFEKLLERSLQSCRIEEETHVVDTALYEELMVLDDQLLVENQEAFKCEVCLNVCEPTAGVIIAECLHAFCKECISTLVEMTTDVEIHCPYRDSEYSCEKIIQHREIKQIVSQEVFDKFLEKSFSIAMRSMSDARNCQFTDCKGWICIDGNNTFTCAICKRINCVLCKGLHDPQVINCEEYRRTLNNPNQFSETLLQNMVNTKEAMLCPCCGVVIEKVAGCDAIICVRCKTEICWATRGPRWGPRGRGDTSGGCGCKANRRCHPNCKNCH